MGVHGNDEYVPVEMVIDYCKVYAEMILRWCGIAEVKAHSKTSGKGKNSRKK